MLPSSCQTLEDSNLPLTHLLFCFLAVGHFLYAFILDNVILISQSLMSQNITQYWHWIDVLNQNDCVSSINFPLCLGVNWTYHLLGVLPHGYSIIVTNISSPSRSVCYVLPVVVSPLNRSSSTHIQSTKLPEFTGNWYHLFVSSNMEHWCVWWFVNVSRQVALLSCHRQWLKISEN